MSKVPPPKTPEEILLSISKLPPKTESLTQAEMMEQIWKDIVERIQLGKRVEELEQTLKAWMRCDCDMCSGKACDKTRALYALGKKLGLR